MVAKNGVNAIQERRLSMDNFMSEATEMENISILGLLFYRKPGWAYARKTFVSSADCAVSYCVVASWVDGGYWIDYGDWVNVSW